MRRLAFIMLAVVTMTACAQKSPVEKFIKKQKKVDGISLQEIDIQSEEFAAQFQAEGDEIEEVMAQLEVIKILSSDSTATETAREAFISKANKALSDDDYVALADIKDGDENVGVFMRYAENGLINEMVLLIGETESVNMIYVKGEIDMSKTLSSDIFSSLMGGKKGKTCD